MQHGERLNTLTHLGGALLAASASIPLLVRAAAVGGGTALASTAVYAVSLVLMYACSSAYHGASGVRKRRLQRLDHLSIYLLIAGSYTPFCLLLLERHVGLPLLALVWALALFGMAQEMRVRRGTRVGSMLVYLLMGWAAAGVNDRLQAGLGTAGFAWLLGGGLAYTGGTVFYALDKRLRHAHGIWHGCVLAGSAAHYITIYCYVL